ncbi:MAG: hypothetical protein ACK5RQ_11345 [Bacteroidota bacterium]
MAHRSWHRLLLKKASVSMRIFSSSTLPLTLTLPLVVRLWRTRFEYEFEDIFFLHTPAHPHTAPRGTPLAHKV